MAKKLEISFDKLLELTHRLDFFNIMNEGQRIRVLKQLNGDLFVYEVKEYIVDEGSMDSDLYIILAGNTRVEKGKDEFCALGALTSGDIFGEVSFVTNEKRMSSVMALEETIVLQLSQKKFSSLDLEVQVLIKDKVILKLIARLDKMNRRVLKLRNM
ncbi:cyclic nucleotide-binding domain-containing protein [Sulfurimonas sp. MAG313]|nr:cyclic nucleotide-binding domain-containing protein [Sulfurimonas sp. MAG313]MDF1881913.1 cyclic nucleotide-binding domain-containing protein [Sulfurimonas sp. MAG313]